MMKKKRKILLIDDEAAILEILSDDIKSIDPEVEIHSARSAREAMKILETNVFWGIITDIKMPEMSGLDFLEVTKKYHQIAGTRLLVMSAFIPNELVGQKVKGGLIQQKPLGPDLLHEWLAA